MNDCPNATKHEQMTDDVSDLKKMTEKIARALFGENDHEEGMVDEVKEIKVTLIGNYEKEGLLSKVEKLRSFTQVWKKAIWILVAALAGGYVKMFFF